VLGAGGATWAEIQSLLARKDGKVDEGERLFLRTTFTTLRIGTLLILLSGIGLILLQYFGATSYQTVLSDKFWMKTSLVVLILGNALLLAKKAIPFALGATLSFSAWWFATLLGAWRGVTLSYLDLAVVYALFAVGVYAVLSAVHATVLRSPSH
jgi:hypothetical protein